MILLVKVGYSNYIVPEKYRDAAISVLGSLQPVKQGGGYNTPVYEDICEEADIEIKFIPESQYKTTSGTPEMLDKILKLEEDRKTAESKRYEAQREASKAMEKVKELEVKLAGLPAPVPDEMPVLAEVEGEF